VFISLSRSFFLPPVLSKVNLGDCILRLWGFDLQFPSFGGTLKSFARPSLVPLHVTRKQGRIGASPAAGLFSFLPVPRFAIRIDGKNQLFPPDPPLSR